MLGLIGDLSSSTYRLDSNRSRKVTLSITRTIVIYKIYSKAPSLESIRMSLTTLVNDFRLKALRNFGLKYIAGCPNSCKPIQVASDD